MEVSGWVYILGITYVCTTARLTRSAEFQVVSFASVRRWPESADSVNLKAAQPLQDSS
jgi:hypothetical protein